MLDKSEMIFGVRAVIEALQAGKEIDKILVKKDIQSDLSKELFAALKGTLIPVQRVPVERINRITRKNHQGVIAFISSVASGGEIARVMLSIKAMIAGAVKLPTIVFDEIDTGVSGEIADRMADMMQEMGEQNRQVISITHLPQIAARGRAHYKVYKKDSDTETNSHIRRLTDEERVEEIAHMLSGATLTEAALSNAKALLNSD